MKISYPSCSLVMTFDIYKSWLTDTVSREPVCWASQSSSSPQDAMRGSRRPRRWSTTSWRDPAGRSLSAITRLSSASSSCASPSLSSPPSRNTRRRRGRCSTTWRLSSSSGLVSSFLSGIYPVTWLGRIFCSDAVAFLS